MSQEFRQRKVYYKKKESKQLDLERTGALFLQPTLLIPYRWEIVPQREGATIDL